MNSGEIHLADPLKTGCKNTILGELQKLILIFFGFRQFREGQFDVEFFREGLLHG